MTNAVTSLQRLWLWSPALPSSQSAHKGERVELGIGADAKILSVCKTAAAGTLVVVVGRAQRGVAGTPVVAVELVASRNAGGRDRRTIDALLNQITNVRWRRDAHHLEHVYGEIDDRGLRPRLLHW